MFGLGTKFIPIVIAVLLLVGIVSFVIIQMSKVSSPVGNVLREVITQEGEVETGEQILQLAPSVGQLLLEDLSLSELQEQFFKNLLPRDHFQTIGQQKVLVVLAEFKDVKHEPQHTKEYFEQKWFGANGLTDYFQESSYGQFKLQGVVTPWISLPKKKSYYGLWVNLQQDIVKELSGTVNFKEYDGDNDGYIDFLAIIAAGPPVDTKQIENAEEVSTPDNVAITRFTFYPEYADLFVFIHEFAHLLGLEDQYYQLTAASYAGYYGIMGPGHEIPSYPTVLDKIQLGWLTQSDIPVIQKSGVYTLSSTEKRKSVYRIPIPVCDPYSQEYFLLENRFREQGFDSQLPDKGLVVWHVDEWIKEQGSGVVPNMRITKGHRQLSMPALCNYIVDEITPDDQCLGNDDYMTLHKRGDLTPLSTPNSHGYYFPSGISITDVSERGENVSFTVTVPACEKNSLPVIESIDIEQEIVDWEHYPFVMGAKLTVNASDPDGDALYYFWDIEKDSPWMYLPAPPDDKLKPQFEFIEARERTLVLHTPGLELGETYTFLVSVSDGFHTARKKFSFTAAADK